MSIRKILRLVVVSVLLICFANPTDANALIFPSPQIEPDTAIPDDFPYWEHVTQRRYEGATVLYLGSGWAMTARHVGMGEIFLKGEIFLPNIGSARTLMNLNGSASDMMIFQLALNVELPEMAMLPLAKTPPREGETVLLIGFGRERAKVVEWEDQGRTQFGFEWTEVGRKRWGTNKVVSNREILIQEKWTTRALTFRFDPPLSAEASPFESHAAFGDSGGAVFVQREDQWLLAGMITSITSQRATPGSTAQYGDMTYAADIAHYRSEIFRWTRSQCANEQDDDRDGKIDFPLDPDCSSPTNRYEHDLRPIAIKNAWMLGLAGLSAMALWRLGTRLREGKRRRRRRRRR
jgi:hypothetical protein